MTNSSPPNPPLKQQKIPYKSPNPNSGITTYEIRDDAIILEFKTGKYRYVYDAAKPGPEHVTAMAKLAAEGKGLTTYVSRHIQENYARKLPLQ